MDNKKEQFSLIYDQYIDKIYRFVYLKVSSQEAAEDITSKVFTKAWEVFKDQNENIKNQNAFLYRIAQNRVIDYYRERGRRQTISTDNLAPIADDRTDIHEKAIFNADMVTVKAALANVKQEYQDIIIWHYLEDMPTEEIAMLLGKPAGTVRVMIHRGLEMLKEQLVQEA
ncbi:MAG: RNA polymerase sigma factor [Candidatus Staskawiczbacteria bacterium]|nr:RNA polymerase sigma factor [Candidatus Staskawiczbacteria bacterium]